MKHNYLLVLHIVLKFVAFHCSDNVYFLLCAFADVIPALYLYLNKVQTNIVLLYLLFTIGNLIDEIVGLGCVRSAFEYLFAITVLILISCRLKK